MSEYREMDRAIGEAASTNPTIFRQYRTFADDVWASPHIDPASTEVIAVGVSHIARSAYCVDHHAAMARQLGVGVEVLVEAGVLAAAVLARQVTGRMPAQLRTGGRQPDSFLLLPLNTHVRQLHPQTKALLVVSMAFALRDDALIGQALDVAQQLGIEEPGLIKARDIAAAVAAESAIQQLHGAARTYDL
ncbi:carboxymuconolactone decarboxylase family protein [Saxibacter everestensis]|uniref:Carboxymuconolactone decarboxylase family protein n=1 Tax=Saxibacter everestensis TaxID=2909229 RepID=A0ABY8QR42_9MICO|nr:carboxymuconolactone decarboxylase family protein [Brevibacteriaceae bacterium ZFBP1038]